MMKRQCFPTDTDTEVPALTTSRMREVDRIAMRETGPNLFQIMENADRSLAEMALERLCETGKSESCCASGHRCARESGYRLRSISSGGDDSEFSKGLRSK